MGDYDKKKALILDGEESFARAVALGVVVKRPLSPWHFILPGMFLFDFLRRSGETRRYSDLFLFPRKLALSGTLNILSGEDREDILSRIEDKMKQWLASLNLSSEILLRKEMDEINLLVDHYSRLLRAEGNDYQGLIKDAYPARESYEAYLNRLGVAEKEGDLVIAEMRGKTEEILERLRAERVQVMELRAKEINRIFPRTGE